MRSARASTAQRRDDERCLERVANDRMKNRTRCRGWKDESRSSVFHRQPHLFISASASVSTSPSFEHLVEQAWISSNRSGQASISAGCWMPGAVDQFVAAMSDHRLHALAANSPNGTARPRHAGRTGMPGCRSRRWRPGESRRAVSRKCRHANERREPVAENAQKTGDAAASGVNVTGNQPISFCRFFVTCPPSTRGDQLSAQADAKHRDAPIDHPPHELLLADQPGINRRVHRRSWAPPSQRANRGLRAQAAVDRGPGGCGSADALARGPRRQYWRRLRTPRAASSGCA